MFGFSFVNIISWYVVSSEWSYRSNYNMILSIVFSFIGEIVEVFIYDLVDNNGVKVYLSWFGLGRKRDTVVVFIFFGIFVKLVRGKKL